MTTDRQAELLARWLQQEPGAEPPVGLDEEAVEAVYALRPDRAPPPRLTIEQVLAEVRSGPLAPAGGAELDGEGGAAEDDAAAVAALVQWLEGNPGAEPADDIDPDIVEAVYALRPDLAPAPRVSLDDIFGAVTTGPFARAAAAEVPGSALTAAAGAPRTAPTKPQRRDATATTRRGTPPDRRRSAARWLVPGLGGLAVAATALMLVLPGSDKALQAPSPFSAESTLAEEGRPAALRPAAAPAAASEPAPEAVAHGEAGAGAAPPPPAPQGAAASAAGRGAVSKSQADTPQPPADVARRLQANEELRAVGYLDDDAGVLAGGSRGGLDDTGGSAGLSTASPAQAPGKGAEVTAAVTGDSTREVGVIDAAGRIEVELDEAVAEDAEDAEGPLADAFSPDMEAASGDAPAAYDLVADASVADASVADEASAVETETTSTRGSRAAPKADRAERRRSSGPVLPLLSRKKEAPAAQSAPAEVAPAAAEPAPEAEEEAPRADAPTADGAPPSMRDLEQTVLPDLAALRAAAWPLSAPPDVTAGRPDVAAAYAAAAAADAAAADAAAADAAGDDDAWLSLMQPLLSHSDPDVAQDAAYRIARRQLSQGQVNDAIATTSTGLRRGGRGVLAARLYALQGEAWERLGATESAIDAYARAIEAR